MKRLLLVTLICGLFATLFPLRAIAAPPSQDEEPPCNPLATFLKEKLDLPCTDLMAYQVDGVSVGLGEIMIAYFLTTVFPDVKWDDLVEMHVTGDLGWGQIVKAYTLASVLEVSAEDLLADREAGMGWGEIRKEEGLEPGKPPWAGPPPWAKGHGKPDWAGPHAKE